jgi:hypothetical protein
MASKAPATGCSTWQPQGRLQVCLRRGIKRPETAQFYLTAIEDKEGQTLDGGGNYRMTVRANACGSIAQLSRCRNLSTMVA